MEKNKIDSIIQQELIAAPITSGFGAVSIIRISGAFSWEIVKDIFTPAVGDMSHGRILYGKLHDNNNIIDNVLVSFFKSPHSYTGEDIAEINIHGSRVILNRVMEMLFARGVRMAHPGEFTKRAFINGKIDLTEAEAIDEVIRSTSEFSLNISLKNLYGGLKQFIEKEKIKFINILTRLELNIDFQDYTDKDDQINLNDMLDLINSAKSQLEKLYSTSEAMRITKQGIKIAVIGRANTGKSSLCNRLLLKDKIIVSSIPGTTRDIIETNLNIGAYPVVLFDTAGFIDSKNELDKISIKKTQEILSISDLNIVLFDNSMELSEIDKRVISLTNDKNNIYVLNKLDMPARVSIEELNRLGIKNPIKISVKENININNLIDSIQRNIESIVHLPTKMPVLIKERYKILIKSVLNKIDILSEQFKYNEIPEVISITLREIIDTFGEITGDVCNEDILDNIFSKFCIGK